jgi:RNA polymerase subunit RPABC4/transcription elongation factor Spt4
MCNVRMIRTEPGLVSIPLEKAVYCENCRMVSSSARHRCGLCGSDQIVRLAFLIVEPLDPDPAPVAVLAA